MGGQAGGAAKSSHAPIIAYIGTEERATAPQVAGWSDRGTSESDVPQPAGTVSSQPLPQAPERPASLAIKDTVPDHADGARSPAASATPAGADYAGFSFESMPTLSGPHTVLGGSFGLSSRKRDSMAPRDPPPNASQAASSRRSATQYKVAGALARLRDQWIQAGFRNECLIRVDPDWREFTLECEQDDSSTAQVATVLSAQGLFHSPASASKDGDCVYLGVGPQRRHCRATKRNGGLAPPEPD